MSWSRSIAAIAAILGLISVAMGVRGFHSLEFIQWALSTGGVFGNPEYGNLSEEDWRSGYTNAMIAFLTFGALALVSAGGLFYRRRWAYWLWLTLLVLLMLNGLLELPKAEAWFWLLFSTGLFGASWFGLRRARVHADTAP